MDELGKDLQLASVGLDQVRRRLELLWVRKKELPGKCAEILAEALLDAEALQPLEGRLELPRMRFDDAFHAVADDDRVKNLILLPFVQVCAV